MSIKTGCLRALLLTLAAALMCLLWGIFVCDTLVEKTVSYVCSTGCFVLALTYLESVDVVYKNKPESPPDDDNDDDDDDDEEAIQRMIGEGG